MTKITSFDLTPFYRNTVGIDNLFDRITRNLDMAANAGNYPPYDILKTGDECYEIRLAVAGVRQGDVSVEIKDGQLVIEGTGNSVPENAEYLHHGISHRGFIRTFELSDYVEVREATLRDGVLAVKLERQVPEAFKPKKINIIYDPAV